MIKKSIWLCALVIFVCNSGCGMEKVTQKKRVQFAAGVDQVKTGKQTTKYTKLDTRRSRPVHTVQVGKQAVILSNGQYNKMDAALKQSPMPVCCVIL